ncbi:regulator of G-protein signaling 20-like isoform X2 [Carassius auratus]|uniref:Regulator of G-protein signaling 20-like isoform X2 n=1 Tax=Carassius auratus TaxID=7957 RepID=A0A6P6RBJ9_CARAU|nr:regulator of G-protein signaling 20-like isoform X2 [Carassius auratus]XP_052473468.1 regulator of G-protein signaling 20-like isoform X2 [Carassius gibelio]
MPCNRIILKWEVWPSSVVQSIWLSPCLMWGQLRHLLLACQHDGGYLATGSYENEDQNDNTEDRSKDPISFQPMGSERMEMRKRQMSVQQESVAGTTAPAQNEQPGQGNRGSNACCFCWCCCCSCSWNEDREERNRRASYDLKAEGNADFEESLKPTAEEVLLWGQSFDQLMHCPAGRSAFRQFLRTEFSEENMLFWLACEEFSKETNKSVIEERARIIYEDYISILSPKEVSLDSRVREVINRNMLEPTSHTFDDAQLQIYTLMQRDSYPRFMNSPVYKNLIKTVSEQLVES